MAGFDMKFTDLHIQLLAQALVPQGERLTARVAGTHKPWWAFGFLKRTLKVGSLNTLIKASRISSWVWPGKMRQLTFAVARCGNAFGAWPPLSMVATQVVRRVELKRASFDKRSMAKGCGGSCNMARISAEV